MHSSASSLERSALSAGSLAHPGRSPAASASEVPSSDQPAVSSLLGSTPHPSTNPQSLSMQQMVLSECQDLDEAEVMRAAAERRREELDELSVAPPVALAPLPAPPAGVEPAFEFSVVPPVEELKDVSEVFVSQYMLDVVSSWPQPVVSRKRKLMNKAGKECAGARRGADRGTNATLKTWSSRIRTACAFSNFVGSTVCLHEGRPRPTDVEIDRGVRKFFRCLTAYTKLVVTTFLECRRRGYRVAGGGRALSATSLKDYSSGLTFLFAEAKEDGMRGVTAVVPDCCERSSPWQPKGVAEMVAERRVREDPGGYTGNPMATADVRDFRGATNKEARHDGETQLSGGAVTTEMMDRLFDEMVRAHAPPSRKGHSTASDAVDMLISSIENDASRRVAQSRLSTDAAVGRSAGLSAAETAEARRGFPGASGGPRPGHAVGAEASGDSRNEPGSDAGDATDMEGESSTGEHESGDGGLPAFFKAPSNALADFLVYVFYSFAFITIARPITLINLKFKDLDFPDLSVAQNEMFFNLYVRGAPLRSFRLIAWWRVICVSDFHVSALFCVECACTDYPFVISSLLRLSHFTLGGCCYHFLLLALFGSYRHGHHRFFEVALRVTKTGASTNDVLNVRVFSFFANVSTEEEKHHGVQAFVQCPSEELNLPQLLQPVVLFSLSAPGVHMDMVILAEQPIFPSLSQRTMAGCVAFFKKRSETDVNGRFVADLARIGQDLVLGERACRMYGFRRGGAQALLDRTGLYEQVMKLGEWNPTSNSFLRYITQMNARGTLRSTLRSFAQDDVTQVVAQLLSTYNTWAVGLVRDLCAHASFRDGVVDHAAMVEFEAKNVKVLGTLVCECVLSLRNGKEEEAASEREE